MKISVDVDPPTIFDDVLSGVQSWLLNLDNGIVEGGSSGAPYYNQNHQIIGQHTRRPQNIGNTPPPACNMSRTIGGRFDQSWTGGGTNATRLSNWLDQTGTNAITTNTTNVSNLFAPNASFSISGDNIFCTTTSNNYFISNLPVGATVQWQVTPSGIVTVNSPNSAQTTLTKNSDGVITLSVSITNPCGSPYVATKTITTGTPNLTGTINPASSTQPLGMFNNITGPATTYVSYTWPSVSNITITTLGSNPYTPVYSYTGGFYFNLTGGLAIRIAGTSTCNGSVYSDRYFTRSSGGYRMIVSPNPAKEKMTVSIVDVSPSIKSSTLQEPVTMTLYNANSMLLIKRWTFSANQKDYTLNIQAIKMGQYVLVVEKGKNRQSQKITIK